MKNRKAFTITELLVGLTIITILAGSVSLSLNNFKVVKAKSEAERLAMYLINLTQKYSKMRKNFDIEFDNKNASTKFSVWPNNSRMKKIDTYEMKKGCTFAWNGNDLKYKYESNDFNKQGGTFVIRDSENQPYYVIIKAVKGGRIRTSPIRPKDLKNPE